MLLIIEISPLLLIESIDNCAYMSHFTDLIVTILACRVFVFAFLISRCTDCCSYVGEQQLS